MSSSEGSVGDVEVEQGSQASREGGLDIQVLRLFTARRETCAPRPGAALSCKRRVGYTQLLE